MMERKSTHRRRCHIGQETTDTHARDGVLASVQVLADG